jgi:hypothetical protein
LTGKPTAVVSASVSPNAAKWAHGDTVKSLGVAGAAVVENAHLHFGTIGQRFGETHPREDAEALTRLAAAVGALVEATEAVAAA